MFHNTPTPFGYFVIQRAPNKKSFILSAVKDGKWEEIWAKYTEPSEAIEEINSHTTGFKEWDDLPENEKVPDDLSNWFDTPGRPLLR